MEEKEEGVKRKELVFQFLLEPLTVTLFFPIHSQFRWPGFGNDRPQRSKINVIPDGRRRYHVRNTELANKLN